MRDCLVLLVPERRVCLISNRGGVGDIQSSFVVLRKFGVSVCFPYAFFRHFFSLGWHLVETIVLKLFGTQVQIISTRREE